MNIREAKAKWCDVRNYNEVANSDMIYTDIVVKNLLVSLE
jgi:hypothetical protein